MGTARQAVAAARAGGGIHRFPPVAGAGDQVVPLLAEAAQVMADRQVAKSQQIRNRHLLGTGQTGTALAAVVGTEPAESLALQALQRGFLAGVQRTVGRGEAGPLRPRHDHHVSRVLKSLPAEPGLPNASFYSNEGLPHKNREPNSQGTYLLDPSQLEPAFSIPLPTFKGIKQERGNIFFSHRACECAVALKHVVFPVP